MIISPFTPLFFGTRKSDGIESRYVQTFAPTDRILLEVFAAEDEAVNVTITDDTTGVEFPITCNVFTINQSTKLHFNVISGLTNGYYKVTVNDHASDIFHVTDDDGELSTTTLIQYSNKDNKQRTDALFVIDGMRHFFDFRVPGGFKDSGWTFAVDNEQFVTAEADPIELYALESTQKRFTLGYQQGVPVVFAELLNRLLTCSYVYFDGVRYARKDSSAPEMNVQLEGLDSFVFNQLLQQVNNLNPTIETANHILIRRVDSTHYRAADTDPITNRII